MLMDLQLKVVFPIQGKLFYCSNGGNFVEAKPSDQPLKRARSFVFARRIYDSFGNPTVEVQLTADSGFSRAVVPSRVSTGIHESLELRDKDVLTAVSKINDEIGPALVTKGLQVTEQAAINKLMIELDGTENKANLGANVILGVSMAVCKAAAEHSNIRLYEYIAQLAGTPKIVLPVPAFNVINGGAHAENKLAMQEFMILPVGAKNFREAMDMGKKISNELQKEIRDEYGMDATAVGEENTFAPKFQDFKEALDLLKTFISKAGYSGKVKIGMDIGASEFYKDGKYDLDFKNEKSDPSKWIDGDQLGDLYKSFIKDYPVVSIEDAFHQDDCDSWSKLLASTSIQLVGNDLTVTNPKRIRQAIEKKSGNCLLLKVNQIGTVTESIEAAKLARENGWGVMVSDRFCETDDTFIADFVVGLSAGQIKTGAPCRSEQIPKYERILGIEEKLGNEAVYAGEKFRDPLA
ncbi:2-phospho-D-glycerate hydro-lyase [Aphelenchoides besseyi]|nr:2-phospho-D-glycerate hydro-lyase [Aphelenchoides besseyi]KAI6193854.1 2-phospho-D-glycerate hydro-lyase [Aphelenchoides besseyi]